jgi:hypothetical protein
MWTPRSPLEQAEAPRPRDAWAAKVRSRLVYLILGLRRPMPYQPVGVLGTVGGVRVWQYAPAPLVPPDLGYQGEAYLRLHPPLQVPHPTGLPDTAPVVAPKPEGSGGS